MPFFFLPFLSVTISGVVRIMGFVAFGCRFKAGDMTSSAMGGGPCTVATATFFTEVEGSAFMLMCFREVTGFLVEPVWHSWSSAVFILGGVTGG